MDSTQLLALPVIKIGNHQMKLDKTSYKTKNVIFFLRSWLLSCESLRNRILQILDFNMCSGDDWTSFIELKFPEGYCLWRKHSELRKFSNSV